MTDNAMRESFRPRWTAAANGYPRFSPPTRSATSVASTPISHNLKMQSACAARLCASPMWPGARTPWVTSGQLLHLLSQGALLKRGMWPYSYWRAKRGLVARQAFGLLHQVRSSGVLRRRFGRRRQRFSIVPEVVADPGVTLRTVGGIGFVPKCATRGRHAEAFELCRRAIESGRTSTRYHCRLT